MKVLTVACFLLLATAAHADGPNALTTSISKTGTEAVAWFDAQGIEVSTGTAGALRAPAKIPTQSVLGAPWVVALPVGGARVGWVEQTVDFASVLPTEQVLTRSAVIAADGIVGPVEDVGARWDAVATDERGDTLLARGTGTPGVAFSDAGGRFATVPGWAPVEPMVALAANGTALVAGAVNNAGSARIRPLGGDWGPELALPDPVPDAVSVASDGSAAIGFHNQTVGTAVALRKPGEAFSHWLSLDRRLPEQLVVTARPGGAATVVSDGATVYDLSADRVVTPAATGAPVAFDAASTEDGGVSIGIAGPAVRSRDRLAAFSDPVVLGANQTLPSVARSSGGQFAAWIDGNTDVHAAGQILAHYDPEPTPAPGPDVGLHMHVATGPIHVVKGIATVPLRCNVSCFPKLSVDGGGKVQTDFEGGVPTVARVAAPKHAKTLRIRLRQPLGPSVRFVRRVVHTKWRAAPCGSAAKVLTTGPGGRSLRETATDTGGNVESRIAACVPNHRPVTLTTLGDYITGGQRIDAVAITGGRAAIVTTGYNQYSAQSPRLTVLKLKGGRPEASDLLAALSPTIDYLIIRMVLTGTGAPVFVDRVANRYRVRSADRVLDAGPGVDPASLKAVGKMVTWTRSGALQTATP